MTFTDPFTKGTIPDGDGTLWIDSVTVVGLGSLEARTEGGIITPTWKRALA
jgi:hypothetical protein